MADTKNDEAGLSGLPMPGAGVRQFTIGNELVIVAPKPSAAARGIRGAQDQQDSNVAFSINSSARLIWEMCDGKHSPQHIVDALAAQFDVPLDVLEGEVRRSLTHYSRVGILQGLYEHVRAKSAVTFAFGIEDRPFYWWQTAILLESLAEKLPGGWAAHLVICNDGESLSPRLQRILDCYLTPYTTTEKPAADIVSDNAGGRRTAGRLALKVEALAAIGPDMPPETMLCLIDADSFLYGDFPIGLVPTECAVMQPSEPPGIGVRLDKLAEALNVKGDFTPGAGPIFLTGKATTNQDFIDDCRRLTRALADLDASAVGSHAALTEPPAFALAMALNAITYDVLDLEQFASAAQDAPAIAAGTLYRYGGEDQEDSRAAFFNSTWRMGAYQDRDFLKTDFEEFAKKAVSDHEHHFYQLARGARNRLNV